MASINDTNGPKSEVVSAKWPLLCTLAACCLGAAFFAIGVESGLLPTATGVGVTESVLGALVYGLFFGLTVGQLAQSAARERKVPWLVLVGSLVGAAVGAILGYAIVSEFFGAICTGLGGALAGGFLGNRASCRQNSSMPLEG